MVNLLVAFALIYWMESLLFDYFRVNCQFCFCLVGLWSYPFLICLHFCYISDFPGTPRFISSNSRCCHYLSGTAVF